MEGNGKKSLNIDRTAVQRMEVKMLEFTSTWKQYLVISGLLKLLSSVGVFQIHLMELFKISQAILMLL